MTVVPHFSQVDAPGRLPGVRWLAELVDATGWHTSPYAVAWITDARPVLGMSLDYVLVPDECRRRGFGAQLVRACLERWPDLIPTNPIGPEGEALMASLVREGLFAEG